MKTALWTAIVTCSILLAACDTEATEKTNTGETKENTPSSKNLNEESFIKEMGKLLNGEQTFTALSITYDTWVAALDESTKAQFFEEEGQVFETLLPKWKAESESLLRELCAYVDTPTEITDYRLNRGRQTGNLTSFEGRITVACGGQTKKVRISAIKIDDRMYLLLLKAMPPEVQTY
jgi:hypothetical protein